MRQKGGALTTQAAPAAPRADARPEAVAVALAGAVFGVRAAEPVVAVVPADRTGDESLPCGTFLPCEHATLEDGIRTWISQQTGVELGFLEQLCALSRRPRTDDLGLAHVVSISFLALVGPVQCSDRTRATWRSWYSFLPWEDWRSGRPECLNEIDARLATWADADMPRDALPDQHRRRRVRVAFGGGGAAWDEEKVAERFELLCEAGIIASDQSEGTGISGRLPRLVHPVLGDQTLVLARAVGELRRAIKYRPVLFELMHQEFTLFELQKAVEAILGPHLHKQNFRRLVEGCGLVEPTGGLRLRTGGRPAQLYRFRRDVIYEHASPGVRLKPGRMH
jgi:hypothetical protein